MGDFGCGAQVCCADALLHGESHPRTRRKDSPTMRRLLFCAALAAAVLVPTASASPNASHIARGTVVGKDRAHHGLVVALPGGNVQTFVSSSAFGRADIGRRIVIRFSPTVGGLPIALSVDLKGHATHAVLRGTIVRLAKRQAILNAGGSALRVTLKAPKPLRTLASVKDVPKVGDTVKVEVEIDDDDSLDASAVVVTGAPAGTTAGSEGEMEVRGKVNGPLVPAAISITTGTGVVVTCAIPLGVTANVIVGDMIELNCDLLGGVWTVRVAESEDEQGDGDQGDDDGTDDDAASGSSGGSDD